jgi:hypothetical protein
MDRGPCRCLQARRMRTAFKWGPCAAVRWGRQARRGIGRDADSFSSGQDALSKSPAAPHGLAGQGEGMDARGRATQEQLPNARQAPSGVSFSLGYFSFGQAKEKYLALRRRAKALRRFAKKKHTNEHPPLTSIRSPKRELMPGRDRRRSAAGSRDANQDPAAIQPIEPNQCTGDFTYVSNNSSIRRYSSCQSSA